MMANHHSSVPATAAAAASAAAAAAASLQVTVASPLLNLPVAAGGGPPPPPTVVAYHGAPNPPPPAAAPPLVVVAAAPSPLPQLAPIAPGPAPPSAAPAAAAGRVILPAPTSAVPVAPLPTTKPSTTKPTTTTTTRPTSGSTSTSSGNPRRTWDENYAQLLTYKAMHGNCEVPYGYKQDPVLGKWVSHLRENQDQKLMNNERKRALNAIGFNWNPQENRWNEQFEKLKAYQQQFGTTKIPSQHKDRTLSKWVKRQRENKSAGILAPHREAKLNTLNFVWKLKKDVSSSSTSAAGSNTTTSSGGRGSSSKTTTTTTTKRRNNKLNEEQWKKQYNKLVAYKAEHGHCNCPKTYEKDPSLGKWVSKQRLQNNRNQLTKERRKQLEAIGFVFSFQAQKKQQEWNHMYQLLKSYQNTTSNNTKAPANNSNNGNTATGPTTTTDFVIPKSGPEASSVARWVQRQREKIKLGKLDPGREVLLRKINFPFPPQAAKPPGAAAAAAAAPTTALIPQRTAAGWVGRHHHHQQHLDHDSDSSSPTTGGSTTTTSGGTGNCCNSSCSDGESNSSNAKEPYDVVAVIVDAMQREDDMMMGDEEEEPCHGKTIAHCIDVLAQYMSTTPAELAARLPLPSTNYTQRGGGGKRSPLVLPGGGGGDNTATAQAGQQQGQSSSNPASALASASASDNDVGGVVSTFGRLMPKIVALRDVAMKFSDDACLRMAQQFLEQTLQRQKAQQQQDLSAQEVQSPLTGGCYDQLLSLAVELGSLLDDHHSSKRCHAVVRSCEMYLDHLLSLKADGTYAIPAVTMSEVSTADEDSIPEEEQHQQQNSPPAAKRRKISN